MSTWNLKTILGALTAISLSLIVMLLTLKWDTKLLLACGIITLALTSITMSVALPVGSCPFCQARPKDQLRTVLGCDVTGSDTESLQSWNVTSRVERICQHCRESRTLIEEFKIPFSLARTEAEAVVLVSNGGHKPVRISSTSLSV